LTRVFLGRLSHAPHCALRGQRVREARAPPEAPSPRTLLDTLEIAAACASAGEETFVFDDLDGMAEWDEDEEGDDR